MSIQAQLERTRAASWSLALVHPDQINRMLLTLAAETENESAFLLAENRKDLDRMDASDPRFDRLELTEARLAEIAADIRALAILPSPAGRILSETVRPNGLKIVKMAVPFGVIGIIYEARPNVTFDVCSLCFKSGNCCVLKGGSDAIFSNAAILQVIHGVLAQCGIDREVVTLLPAGREETEEMLQARGYIDLVIPRGSQGLINYVREHAAIPVIETGAGICHTYFDLEGDAIKGAAIIYNAKTRRPSVCNALDCLIMHQERISELPGLAGKLSEKEVVLYADQPALQALIGRYPASLLFPATAESFGTEFLSLKMAVKTVGSFEDALRHIARYSSKHSEAIVTENAATAASFLQRVDAAVVYANASTAFTDGAQFGLGTEIGISTQKLHARGPMALEELTTYKWVVQGDGHTRS